MRVSDLIRLTLTSNRERALVKLTRKGPSSSRIDYRWPVDREKGFEKTSMIFGIDGRLTAIDYESSRAPHVEVKKREPRG
jgi:hypothetical protein